jgi:large subunit ribosomal protein L15
MLIHEITSVAGKHKVRKRVGRGIGSGNGKTSGRGHKGAGSRSGSNLSRTLAEGGQMPLFRRMPKRGFSNYQFTTRYEVVNVSQLDKFADGAVVGIGEMAAAGLIGLRCTRVKILGDGSLTKKLQVSAHKFSKSAQEKIEGCGGAAKVVA